MDTHRRYVWQFVVALPLAVSSVGSGTISAAVFGVTEPWVRVAPNGRSAEEFMQLLSSDGGTLVGARSVVVHVAYPTRSEALATGGRPNSRVGRPFWGDTAGVPSLPT